MKIKIKPRVVIKVLIIYWSSLLILWLLLKKLPFNELNAQGYSLGVRLVWLMKKLNANLIEVPIHFKDRDQGKSKIPKLQIFVSFFDLLSIKFKDIFLKQKFYETNETYEFPYKIEDCNLKNCDKN